MIEIEQGIPMPPPRKSGGGGGNQKYPWEGMQIGDSFFVPQPPGITLAKLQIRVNGSAAPAGKRLGTRYTVRQVEGGVRVWRVE